MQHILGPWPIPPDCQRAEVSRTLTLLDRRYQVEHEEDSAAGLHFVKLTAWEKEPGADQPETLEVTGELEYVLANLRLFCFLRGVEVPDGT